MITINTPLGDYDFTYEELKLIAERRLQEKNGSDNALRLAILKRLVTDYYGVKESELVSRSRKRHIIDARHTLILLLRENTTLHLVVIGRICGSIDHSTVIKAIESRKGLINVDFVARKSYQDLTKLFVDELTTEKTGK